MIYNINKDVLGYLELVDEHYRNPEFRRNIYEFK